MKSIGALQWLAKLISRTEENSFRIGELEYIYIYIYVWNLLWDLPGAKEAYEHTDWIYISIDEATKRIYIGS